MNRAVVPVPDPDGREAARLAALAYLGAARPEADRVLQGLVEDAREAFGAELCMVNLITSDAQYFRAWAGELPAELAEARQDPRERSMCQYVVGTEAPLVVRDLLADARFEDQYFCVNYGIRFYAGTPLTTSDGYTIGSLCLLGTQPREFARDNLTLLGTFARAVVGRLELLGALSRERAANEEETVRGSELQRALGERRRAEEALREKEERFRALIQHSTDIVMIIGGDGAISYASPSTRRVLGHDPEDLVGGDAFALVHPDDATRVRAFHAWGNDEPGVKPALELRMRRADGSWRCVEGIGNNLLDDPSVGGVVVNFRDVTDRKEAEEELRRRKELYETLLEAQSEIGEGFVIAEGERIVYANEAFCEISGYDAPELAAMPSAFELLPPADRAPAEARLRRRTNARAEGSADRKEAVVLHKSGRRVHIEFGIKVLEGSDSPRFVMVVRDTTQRKRAQEALRRSEERFRSLVQNASDIVTILDADGTVRYVSPSVERVLGYRPEERVGEHTFEYVHPDDAGRVRTLFTEGLEKGMSSASVEFRFLHKDGSWRHLESVATNLLDDPAVEGVVINSRDITERKQAEEALRRNLKALAALLEAGRLLTSTLESEEVISRLLEIMRSVSNSTATVVNRREEDGRFRVWRSAGLNKLRERARYEPEAEAARRAAFEDGERRLFRLERPDADGEHLVGICLPLRTGDGVLGVLEAYGQEPLADRDMSETLDSLAGQAARALERARLYGDLAERERQLQELVGKLITVQEEERRRVAYEVHDGLTQMLVAAHQHLQSYADDYSPSSAEAREELGWISGLVQRTVREARRVIADLRPTELDDFGLATALRLQAEELRDEGWRVSYKESLGKERLPAAVETALFRVAQEALTNVRKHARTTRVHVELGRLPGAVYLRVWDRGCGFRVETTTDGDGPGKRVGLSGMRERVALLGGSFKVSSRPGIGTLVAANIPLSRNRNGALYDGAR